MDQNDDDDSPRQSRGQPAATEAKPESGISRELARQIALRASATPFAGAPSRAMADEPPPANKVILQEVLPKAGLVYSEKGNLSEVLCKPKIMPIKSITLEKLEQMEAAAAAHAALPSRSLAPVAERVAE